MQQEWQKVRMASRLGIFINEDGLPFLYCVLNYIGFQAEDSQQRLFLATMVYKAVTQGLIGTARQCHHRVRIAFDGKEYFGLELR